MATEFRPAACVFIVAALSASLGCGNTTPTGVGPRASSGNTLFDQHCLKCHSTDGSPAVKGMGGPDLAKIGAAPGRTAGWLAVHIKNPKGHTPDSRMPGFDGSLTAEQIQELADFLAAKK
jgi:mono/diheme cytochrome c family protein